MAETMSIRDRIASLNLNHVGQTPQTPRRPTHPRAQSTGDHNVEFEQNVSATSAIGNQPNIEPQRAAPVRTEPKRPPPPPTLPPRRTSQALSSRPALPPRNHSQASVSQGSLRRVDSLESISSTHSALSTVSARSALTSTTNSTTSRRPSVEPRNNNASGPRLPPPFDPSALPPLPPKRLEPKRPPLSPARSYSSISESNNQQAPGLPSRRKLSTHSNGGVDQSHQALSDSSLTMVGAKMPRPAPQKNSPLAFALNKSTETTPPVPPRPNSITPVYGSIGAPPIPVASRPDLAQLQSSKPKPSDRTLSNARGAKTCIKCRDFKAPDSHAARFPRPSIPSNDVAWISYQLTSPFQSATDKARAIFTWLHHNIAYNTTAFFTGKHQPGDPGTTLSTGYAVCEGYAGLFAALAIKAGLECIVVGGHGKGYGHKALQSGEPIPPYAPDGHAWNAVKIDEDEWKLIDPCWGAGAIRDDKQYAQRFAPEFFTMSNDEFGLRHFPKDQNHFFRSDGRSMSWDSYMTGESGPGEEVTVYTGCEDNHGLSPASFVPKKKHISVRGANPKGRVQFQFGKICEHWDNEKLGKGKSYVYILTIGGKDGRKREEIPFISNGQYWWADVAVEDLGCSGQTIHCYAVTTIDGKDSRGLTVEEFKRAKRSYKGMSYGGVAAWQLV